MTLRLIVFDCDGTLVDSQAAIIHAMREAFDAADLPAPSDEEVRGIVGLSVPQAVARTQRRILSFMTERAIVLIISIMQASCWPLRRGKQDAVLIICWTKLI